MVYLLKNGMKDIGGHIRMYGQDQPSRSEHKRMEQQNNLETVQHEQHISRAAKLQCRWLEVSERERQAHIYNRQLLQDFHRAQDTINDLMLRTAAMNTLRVEYERHLEQLYPQWCQKLQEQRLSTQRKRLEMHLREFMTRMDDESPEAISTNSASYSFSSSSQSNRRQEGPNQRPRNIHEAKRFNKPKAFIKQNNSNLNGFPQLANTWLTQINQPILRSDQMATEPRGANWSRGIPPPPLNPTPRGNVHNSYGPVYQESPVVDDDLRENPPFLLSWAGVGEGSNVPQAQPNPYGSWPPAGLPMLNPAVWRMMGTSISGGEDIPSSQGMGVRGSGGEGGGGGDRGLMDSQPSRSPGQVHSPRQGHRIGVNNGTSDRTCELDTKPVRLSGADDESSVASSTSNRSKNKRKEGKGSQRSVMMEREDTISQQSSAVSRVSLVPNPRHEDLSRDTNIAESSSESAEQTHSVSRRSKSMNGAQIGSNKVTKIPSRENVSITSSKQSGKNAIASIKTQDRPQELTDDETEENAPSVRSDRATGGEDDEDERLETEDEEDKEEGRNEGMVGERVNKGEGANQEHQEKEDDDDAEKEEEEDEKDEEVEVFRSHSRQLKVSREVASDKALSNGSQKSQNSNSKKNGTKSSEMVKEADKRQSKEKPSEDEDDDNEDEDDDDDDDDEEQGKEEDEGEDDDDEGDSEVEAQRPKSAITKEESISNRGNAVNLDGEDEEDDEEEEEEEELYNQEIEDDEEDEVVVDNGYTRTEGQKYNFLKYLDKKDEDDDDIEGLLAPTAEVPKQKEMIPKVIVIRKGSESDSDEEVPEKKKNSPMAPGDKEINSDDEFDHFYD